MTAPVTAGTLTALATRAGVPTGLIGGLVRYVIYGIRPGSFLTAVFENNLMDALRRADPVSAAALPSLAVVIDNYVPAACHGSHARVAAWIDYGGMRHVETDPAREVHS